MLGLRSPKKLVMFLVAVSLTLLSAAILAAQTPTALLDKPAVESSAAMPDVPSKVPATPVAPVGSRPHRVGGSLAPDRADTTPGRSTGTDGIDGMITRAGRQDRRQSPSTSTRPRYRASRL